jgi:hypothetical protein
MSDVKLSDMGHPTALFEAGAWGYVFVEGGQDGLAVFSVAGG